MARHRNPRHELFAQALAAGKSRPEAMIAAGYKPHRGNQNRMAQLPDVVARVDELRKAGDEIIDLRKIDRPRIRRCTANKKLWTMFLSQSLQFVVIDLLRVFADTIISDLVINA